MTDCEMFVSFEQVREFHEKFGHPVRTGGATADREHVDSDLLNLRIKLIGEEFLELLDAVYGSRVDEALDWLKGDGPDLPSDTHDSLPLRRDIVEIADALGDIKYVVDGMALALGINLPAVENEIHRSNMSKLDENGSPIVSGGTDGYPKGKILKGANYTPPNIQHVLDTTAI